MTDAATRPVRSPAAAPAWENAASAGRPRARRRGRRAESGGSAGEGDATVHGNGNPFEAHIYRSLPEIVRVDAIVGRIRTAVALGLLRPGERLQPELEMAESFGVAAATLRDALATLRDEGVVETRRGRNGGTFVLDLPTTSTDELAARLQRFSIAELRDLGDHHVAIATMSVRLAVARAHPSDLDRLEELASALAGAQSPAEGARLDSRFRIELPVAAQSRRLMLDEVRIQSEISELVWAPLATAHDPATASRGHLEVVAAMRAGDPERAERLTAEHIRRNVYHLIDTKLTLGYGGGAEEGQ